METPKSSRWKGYTIIIFLVKSKNPAYEEREIDFNY
jgi:hypothetical protein